jgi:hypothetical protein
MHIRTVFPTPIGFEKLEGDWFELANSQSFNNEFFGQTPGDLHTQEEWKDLTTKLTEAANKYNNEIGNTTPVHISNMWLNRYYQYNSIHPHFHSNCLFSCVMYIQSDTGTVFYRPQPIQFQASEYSDRGFFYDDFTAQPETNGVVFFPANIRHTSIPSSTLRLTISANFNCDSYGNTHSLNRLD